MNGLKAPQLVMYHPARRGSDTKIITSIDSVRSRQVIPSSPRVNHLLQQHINHQQQLKQQQLNHHHHQQYPFREHFRQNTDLQQSQTSKQISKTQPQTTTKPTKTSAARTMGPIRAKHPVTRGKLDDAVFINQKNVSKNQTISPHNTHLRSGSIGMIETGVVSACAPKSILKTNPQRPVSAIVSTRHQYKNGLQNNHRLVRNVNHDFSLNDFLKQNDHQSIHGSLAIRGNDSATYIPARRIASASVSSLPTKYEVDGQPIRKQRKSVTFDSRVKLCLGNQVTAVSSLPVDC